MLRLVAAEAATLAANDDHDCDSLLSPFIVGGLALPRIAFCGLSTGLKPFAILDAQQKQKTLSLTSRFQRYPHTARANKNKSGAS